MNMNYSIICNHDRLQRINDNFIRCLKCGQSMISQSKMLTNKTRQDFTKENKTIFNNFNRNFSNVLEETDNQTSEPLYEYYVDKMMLNKIIVNRCIKYNSQPPKYEIFVNDSKAYLTNEEIQKLLIEIGAFRIDERLMKNNI